MNNNNDNNNEIGSILVNQARSTYGYSIPYPLSIPTTHKSFVIRAVSTNSSIHTFKYTLRVYLSCDKQQEQEGTVSPFRRNFVTFGYGGFLVPAIESRNTGWQQTRRKEEKSWFTGEIFLQSRDVSAEGGEGRGLIERSKGGEWKHKVVDNNTVRRRKRGRSVPDLSAGFDVRQFAPTEFSRGDLSVLWKKTVFACSFSASEGRFLRSGEKDVLVLIYPITFLCV